MSISPVRLNHAVLFVADLDRSLRFYTDVFGMDVIATVDELLATRQVLLDADAYTGESSHGATKSLHGADPDGDEFELMWMLPRDQWGPYEHAAPIDHLDLDGEVNRWSGVRTAGQITVATEDEQKEKET